MDNMGDKSTAQQTNSTTCKNASCIFFGSPQTEGYCSVCYKEFIKKKNAPPPASDSMVTSTKSLQQHFEEQSSTTQELVVKSLQEGAASSAATSAAISPAPSVQPVQQVPSPSVEENTQDKSLNLSCSPSSPVAESSPLTPTPAVSTSTSTSTAVPSVQQSSVSEINTSSISSTLNSSAVSSDCPEPSKPKKGKKRRCGICNKKIGLTGFECRCGGLYCSIHRYADMHQCTFDYKVDGKEKIRKANPVVADDKITRF